MQINYKSDFDFLLHLRDKNNVEIFNVDFEWSAKFWSNSLANCFVVRSTDLNSGKWFNDNGVIHIIADNHRLGIGKLKVEFSAYMDNPIYPDGTKKEVLPFELGIELVKDAPKDSTITVEATTGNNANTPADVKSILPQTIALQRGAISINSHPCVVYKNHGYIRVPVKWEILRQNSISAIPIRTNFDVSLDGIDLQQITRVKAVNGPFCNTNIQNREVLAKRLSFDFKIEEERLTGFIDQTNVEKCNRHTSIRLELNEDSKDMKYIMRFPDGKIRAFNSINGVHIITPTREAPDIKWQCIKDLDIESALEKIAGIGIEIETKARYRFATGSKRNTRWIRRRSLRRQRCGVIRVRYAKHKRLGASPWVVLSFRKDSVEFDTIAPIRIKPI